MIIVGHLDLKDYNIPTMQHLPIWLAELVKQILRTRVTPLCRT
jgi:hypothetical protein